VSPEPATPSLLIVDDDDSFRAAVRTTMQALGWRVTEAASAGEARSSLALAVPDIVLVDGMLPDANGRELIAEMRAAGCPAEPIYLSAHFRDIQTLRSLNTELGVQVVLSKPIDLVELGVRLSGALQGHRGAGPADSSQLAPLDPFAELRTAYREQLLAHLTSLATLLQAAASPGGDPAPAIASAHRLRGTAGTYGYFHASQLAGQAEELLLDMTGGVPRDPALLGAHATSLRELRSRLLAEPEPITAVAAPIRQATRVLALLPDRSTREELFRSAHERMLEVDFAATEDEAMQLSQGRVHDCALVSLDLPAPDDAFRAVRRLRSLPGGADLRVAGISAIDDVTLRLGCARERLDLFEVAPIGGLRFIEIVRRLELMGQTQARVLVIEDDAAFLQRASACLRSRDMEVSTLQDPTRCLDALDQFEPDLVLLDIVMPVLSGFDVCRLIRASARWRELPIIVISARLGPEVRIATFQSGADDYVAKPIVEAELIARVSQRVQRSRQAQAQRERDALTNLLLRRPFSERGQERLSMARRQGMAVSVAMIDVDHFKQVNDVHGHLVGDQVLAVLAQVLDQRTRAEDVCARWGGEEFAVVLSNTGPDQARVVLDRVREELLGLTFHGEDGAPFHVSFSGGIACAPIDGATLAEVLKTADDRLFQAKQAGRNRIVT